MTDIALKMLLGERAKYAMLVTGICFATILMTQGPAMFSGILSFSTCYQHENYTLDKIKWMF